MSIVTSAGIQRNPLTPRFGIVGYTGRVGGADIVDLGVPSAYWDFLYEPSLAIGATTFTRGSSGTYFNSAGTLVTAGQDVPRFDYDPVTLEPKGLLIEESRTNLQIYSENFANAAITKQDCSISPTGTNPAGGTGEKVVENTAVGATHRVYYNGSQTGTTDGTYTDSVFAKAAGRNFIRIISLDSPAGNAVFNLATGAVVSSSGAMTGSIEVGPDGYYRCKVTWAKATGANQRLAVDLGQDGTTFSYTGDGTSGALLYGLQLELGSFPTSYIPTTSATVTRSADVCSVTTLTPWFNAATGTLFCEFIPLSGTVANDFVTLSDGSNNNRVAINRQAATGFVRGIASESNVIVFREDSAPVAAATIHRAAVAYSSADSRACVDGTLSTPSVNSAFTSIPANRLGIGQNPNSTGFANGYIRKVAYYNRRLPNSGVQGLTA